MDESNSSLGPHPVAEIVNRRSVKRWSFHEDVQVTFRSPQKLCMGQIEDISLRGCFVRTAATINYAPGALAEIRFWTGKVRFVIVCELRSLQPCKGAGFLFVGSDEATKSAIEALIARLGQENTSPKE